jgi:hypothetical protein
VKKAVTPRDFGVEFFRSRLVSDVVFSEDLRDSAVAARSRERRVRSLD